MIHALVVNEAMASIVDYLGQQVDGIPRLGILRDGKAGAVALPIFDKVNA